MLRLTVSQIGSTEWAEENMDTLASRAIAYLNVDISVFGPGGLRPRATPQLDELIREASKMVFKLYPVSILQLLETPVLPSRHFFIRRYQIPMNHLKPCMTP